VNVVHDTIEKPLKEGKVIESPTDCFLQWDRKLMRWPRGNKQPVCADNPFPILSPAALTTASQTFNSSRSKQLPSSNKYCFLEALRPIFSYNAPNKTTDSWTELPGYDDKSKRRLEQLMVSL
jgi:hypothetical protein